MLLRQRQEVQEVPRPRELSAHRSAIQLDWRESAPDRVPVQGFELVCGQGELEGLQLERVADLELVPALDVGREFQGSVGPRRVVRILAQQPQAVGSRLRDLDDRAAKLAASGRDSVVVAKKL